MVTFDTNFTNLYNRYQIYRDTNEISKNYIAVGYGDVGTGSSGALDLSTIYKLKTTNTFDADFNMSKLSILPYVVSSISR